MDALAAPVVSAEALRARGAEARPAGDADPNANKAGAFAGRFDEVAAQSRDEKKNAEEGVFRSGRSPRRAEEAAEAEGEAKIGTPKPGLAAQSAAADFRSLIAGAAAQDGDVILIDAAAQDGDVIPIEAAAPDRRSRKDAADIHGAGGAAAETSPAELESDAAAPAIETDAATAAIEADDAPPDIAIVAAIVDAGTSPATAGGEKSPIAPYKDAGAVAAVDGEPARHASVKSADSADSAAAAASERLGGKTAPIAALAGEPRKDDPDRAGEAPAKAARDGAEESEAAAPDAADTDEARPELAAARVQTPHRDDVAASAAAKDGASREGAARSAAPYAAALEDGAARRSAATDALPEKPPADDRDPADEPPADDRDPAGEAPAPDAGKTAEPVFAPLAIKTPPPSAENRAGERADGAAFAASPGGAGEGARAGLQSEAGARIIAAAFHPAGAPQTPVKDDRPSLPPGGADPAADFAAVLSKDAGDIAEAAPAPKAHAASSMGANGADAVRQMAAAVRTSHGGERIELRLDPPELGRVHIQFSMGGADSVTAMISSERGDTLDLLRRHSDDLARELGRAGFANVQLEFSSGGLGSFESQAQAERSAGESAFLQEAEEERIIHFVRRSDNRLDRRV